MLNWVAKLRRIEIAFNSEPGTSFFTVNEPIEMGELVGREKVI